MSNVKRFSIVLFLLLCTFLGGCTSPEEKKERHYLKALEYIKQEKPKAAILELRNAIQIDEKYADARYQLGLLYLEDKNPGKAFQELLRAANLDHDNLAANLKVAELYLITRKNDESRKLIERILQKDPKHQGALALLANLELIEGNFDNAAAALDKIGETVNTSDKLLNIKGRIYLAKNEFTRAEEVFQKAISLEGDKFVNYRSLLMLYESTQDQAKIKALLAEMVQKFPENPTTHLLFASYHKSLGNLKGVEEEILKAIETDPENPRYHLMLSDHYLNSGTADKAIAVLTKAEERIEDDSEIRAALATIYFEQKDFTTSRKILDQILSENPGHGKAQLLEARFLIKDNNLQEGIEVLERINKNIPTWAEPYFYLALARYFRGEIDLAQYAISAAIQKQSNESKYHTFLAQLHLMQNAQKEAEKEATLALQLNPRNLRAALIMTTIMINEKKYEKAITVLNQLNNQVHGNLEILGNLVIANLRLDNKAEAEKILEEILELDPGNNRATLLLSELKYKDDLPGSEEFVREQIQRAPEDSGLYVIFGDILLRQKMEQKALDAYEKAIALDPSNIRAYIASVKLLKKLGETEQAMAKYQTMIDQNPKWLQGYMGMAMLYESEGNSQKAMEYYTMALDVKSDFAPAANNLAWLLASSPDGDLAKALRYAIIAKHELPDSPQVADTLGYVHLKRGAYSLAIPQFKLALDKQPKDPTITYHLALALHENGSLEEARRTLEKLLSDEISFAEKEAAKALLAELKQQ